MRGWGVWSVAVFLLAIPLRAEKKPAIKLSFDIDRADYETALLEARRDVRDAEASVRRQKDVFQRQESLYRRRVLAEFEFKEAEEAFTESKFKLTGAKNDVAEAEIQLRIADLSAHAVETSLADKIAIATGYVDLCRTRLSAATFEVERAEWRQAYRAYRVRVLTRLAKHKAEPPLALHEEEEKHDHAIHYTDWAREGVALAKRQLADAEKSLEEAKKG